MIKNQLYPYIETYINEYLYGFTKEQLDVGVMNGVIQLDKLNIRPDKANEKLDKQDSPIWLKAGLISKIHVACSLMNFIGEKPLEVEIENIDILLCPSFKWIIRNQNSFLEETDEHIKEEYDFKDNNSKEVFFKKVHIFDGSIFRKKTKLLEFLKDNSKFSEIIHKFTTKVLKFYYQNNYFINLKIKNIHIRFEDDTFNYYGGTIFGIHIECLELALSAEGKLKKDSFKVTNLNVYQEDVKSADNFIISSNLFLSKLNNDTIEEDYYKIIEEVYDHAKKDKKKGLNLLPQSKKEDSGSKQGAVTNLLTGSAKIKKVFLVENFNCMGKVSIQNDPKGDLFTSKNDKPWKFCLNIFTSDLKVNINPSIIGKLTSFQEFLKGYFLNDPIQDYKPMRKPYNANSDLVKMYQENQTIKTKRKLVVRDWFYYFVWFHRFKTTIYGKPFKNKLQEEFSKYFNICCASQSDIFPQEFDVMKPHHDKEFDDNKLNDSIDLKKTRTQDKLKGTESNKKESKKEEKEEAKEEENLNPDNIQLHLNAEINIKSISLTLLEETAGQHLKHQASNNEDIISNMFNTDNKNNEFLKGAVTLSISKPNSITVKFDNPELKFNCNCKDTAECSVSVKNIIFYNNIGGEPHKIEVTGIQEQALGIDDKERRGNKNKSFIGNQNLINGKF